jgi:hypothetical protein
MNKSEEREPQMHFFSLSSGEDNHRVEAMVIVCGKDVSITIGGGTSYHIGAAAVAIPRPSLKDTGAVSASASVICVTGHKEDQLVRNAAISLASSLNCIVSVNAGLHVDQASIQDIEALVDNFNSLIKQISSKLTEYFHV